MKQLSDFKKFYSGSFNLRLSVFLIFLLNTACVNGLLLATPPDLKMTMESSAKLKKQAEERVRLVKKADQNNNIDTANLNAIETAYGTAKTSFSQWIDTLQNDLKTKKLGSQPSNYETLSQTAANDAEEFNKLVDNTLQLTARGDEMETLKAFIKSGTELVKSIKELDQSNRQKLINDLEALRWKSFSEIN